MDDLLDKICTATFTRHANLSEKEFLKEIGKENAESEHQAVREGIMALLVGCTRELLMANRRLELIIATDKYVKGEENK